VNKTLGLLATSAVVLASACSSPDAVDAATTSAAATAEPAKSLYVAICGFSIAGYDPTYTFRFYVEASLAHQSAHQNGADGLTLAMTPLVGWDADTGQAKPPTNVTHDQTIGQPITATSAITDGKYSSAFGILDVPPLANGINGVAARVEQLNLDGPFQAGLGAPFCAGVAGQLTVPLDYEFVRNENTCLFFPIAEGDPLPVVQASDFHCD
jgi:hypothetical protein